MPVVNSSVTHLGTQIEIHLNGTPVRSGKKIFDSDILCDDGVIILTTKGALTLAAELITECNKQIERERLKNTKGGEDNG